MHVYRVEVREYASTADTHGSTRQSVELQVPIEEAIATGQRLVASYRHFQPKRIFYYRLIRLESSFAQQQSSVLNGKW
jgi:hypothetical protein